MKPNEESYDESRCAEHVKQRCIPDRRYRLIQDDDCHWYIIPAGDEDYFYRWEKAVVNNEDCERDYHDCRVDGPHVVTFANWRDD